MREIKFRGKQIDNGEWVYGDLSVGSAEHGWDESKIFIIPRQLLLERIEVHPDSVGQYIDLKDKNGKDLGWWEGDICTAEYCCEVCFDIEPHVLTGVITQADNGLWMLEYSHGCLPLDCEDLEIEGVESSDYPEFCDAFFVSGTLNGKEMTDEELDWLTENYPETLNELAYESLI